MRFVVFILVSIAIHAAVLNFYFVQKNNVSHTEQVIIQVSEEVFSEVPPNVTPADPAASAPVDVPISHVKTEKKTNPVIKSIPSEDFPTVSVIPAASTAPVVIPPSLETTPKPVYPVSERKAGHEGSVFVSVRIGRDGSLLDAAIKKSSGYKALDRSALAAVKKCPFKPGLRDGIPFEGSLVVEVIFKLK